MKILLSTIILGLTPLSWAGTIDFNSMITEQSKSQKEIHKSLIDEGLNSPEINESNGTQNPEIIVIDDGSGGGSIISPTNLKIKGVKYSIKNLKNKNKNLIEEKQFIRLGEELSEAN